MVVTRKQTERAMMRAMKAGAVLYVGRTVNGTPVRITVFKGIPEAGREPMSSGEFVKLVNKVLPARKRRRR